MRSKRGFCLLGSGLVVAVAALFGALHAGPLLLRKLVVENVILSDSSEAMARWKVTPQPLNYYTYIFNVENPEEVAKGARPVLKEKGPYVYDLFRERVDVQTHDEDDTVSYFDKTIYRFNQNKSGCRSEDDVVTILNAPVLGTGLMLQRIMEMALPLFNDALPFIFPGKPSAFITAKVREVLFEGVLVNCSFPLTHFPVGPVCQGMRSRAPVTFRKAGTDYYFSMFNHLNGTDTKHRVRVSRGRRDPDSLGRISRFGNRSLRGPWRRNSPCNMVNGTDTTIFHPFIRPPEKLPIFVSGSCRSMYATFEYPMQVHGVRALHYVADPKMLASGRSYPPNRCFCPPPPPPEGPDADDKDGAASALPPAATALPPAAATSPLATSAGAEATMTSASTAAAQATTTAAAQAAASPSEASLEPTVKYPYGDDEPTEMETLRRRRSARRPMSREERDASTCLPDGSLDMTSCFGSPVILTLPHFYLGAKEFSDYAIGLKADKAKHETFLDIEPNTGVPLRGGKRVQLNMFLKKIDQIDVLSTVSEGLFPILWVDEGIELEGASLEQLQGAARRLSVLQVVPWVLLGGGVLMAVAGCMLHAHSAGLLQRMASMADERRARNPPQGHEGPPSGPPPGNYGISLGFGPPSLQKKAALLDGHGLGGLHSLKGLGVGVAGGAARGGAGLGPWLGPGGARPVMVRTFCSDIPPRFSGS